MHTHATAAHTAHLDPLMGVGALVMPLLDYDLTSPDGTSPITLHASDYDQMITYLYGQGWEPMPDEAGLGWLSLGTTTQGHDVVALNASEPVVSDPTPEEELAAWNDVLRCAGLSLS